MELRSKLEVQQSLTRRWRITFEQIFLCWLLIMRTGKLEGMVQNNEYFSKKEVSEIFLYCTDRFLDVYEKDMLESIPSAQTLTNIERQFRRIGLPGCGGYLQKFNIRRKVPSNISSNVSKSTETMYCETWSDTRGICWSWNILNRSKKVETTDNRSNLLRDMELGRFKLETNESFQISSKGKKRTELFFIGFGRYPEWHTIIHRDEIIDVIGHLDQGKKELLKEKPSDII